MILQQQRPGLSSHPSANDRLQHRDPSGQHYLRSVALAALLVFAATTSVAALMVLGTNALATARSNAESPAPAVVSASVAPPDDPILLRPAP